MSIRSLSPRSNEDLINHLERFLNTATTHASEPYNRTSNIFDSVSSRDHVSSSLTYSNDDIRNFERCLFVLYGEESDL